jgi:hypothetical protein
LCSPRCQRWKARRWVASCSAMATAAETNPPLPGAEPSRSRTHRGVAAVAQYSRRVSQGCMTSSSHLGLLLVTSGELLMLLQAVFCMRS